MATDYAGLIPDNVASEVIAAAIEQSIVLRLARRVMLPKGSLGFPVNSARPTAKFATAHGGRKQASKIEWSTAKVTPEEIAVLVAIPDDFLADTTFPVWNEVKPLLAEAIAKTLDDAVLAGTGAPATYPSGGITSGLTAVQAPKGSDILDALNLGMGTLEQSGLVPSGFAADVKVAGLLRGLRGDNGQFVYQGPKEPGQPGSVWGLPFAYSADWKPTGGEILAGDWSKLIVGVRQDIRFDMSTEATIFDDAGKLVHSAFQDDVTIMRAYMRVGVALGKPVNTKGTAVSPFVLVDADAATA